MQTAIAAFPAGRHFRFTTLHDVERLKIITPRWGLDYERVFSQFTDRHLIGIPASECDVRRGLHPFSPARTVTMDELPSTIRAQRLAEMVFEEVEAKENRRFYHGSDNEISWSTILTLVRIVDHVTQFYGIGKCLEEWARRAILLHLMGADLAGCGNSLLVNLQPRRSTRAGISQPVPVMNASVDWWMIQVPHGYNDPIALDERPIHALIFGVHHDSIPHSDWLDHATMSQNLYRQVAVTFGDSTSSQINREELFNWWRLISKLSSIEACLALNKAVFEMIQTRIRLSQS